jgi:hypothetical protein
MVVGGVVFDCVRLCRDGDDGTIVLGREDCGENMADLGLFVLGALGPGDGDAEPMRANGLFRTDMMALPGTATTSDCPGMV